MKYIFTRSSLLLIFFSTFLFAKGQLGQTVGTPWTGPVGVPESVADIMVRQRALNINGIQYQRNQERELEEPDRDNLPDNPSAPAVANFPSTFERTAVRVSAAQTTGISFTAATLTNTGAFPPDDMGAVGPTQYIICVNGRITTFNKTTGVADGALNTSQDNFFQSVMTPITSPVVDNFTSDPRIRYDRKSQKWIFIIIDVPCTNASCSTTNPNRILIAVSSASTITPSTTFTYYYFQQDLVSPAGNTGGFADYPTLGIDDNALYIGANMFSSAGSFQGTTGFVVRKSSILNGGPIVVSAFRGLAGAATAGPFTPQGVENMDASSTVGYFIGVDNVNYSTLQLRRITDPGGTPSISANITLTVPTTNSPTPVPHLGNTGGNNGRLDALDDRLFAAMMRSGHLWTAHNIRVSTAGVASTATGARDAARWYDIINLGTTPTLNQSGTIFDATATNPVFYTIPSVMVSGQGHAAFALTSAGLAAYSNASTTGRLATDVAGTTPAPTNTTASSTAYNPTNDPGGSSGRRWGDYSYVSLDPIDDQTMWMVNQFCSSTNIYGCNVTKLIAPPPATPTTCSPSSIQAGQSSVTVTLTGAAVSGSGFYDPGANLAGAIPFHHIAASVGSGVTVNSVTYTDPTHVTLDLNTVNAAVGTATIGITNPDAQTVSSATPILTITNSVLPISLLNLNGVLNSNMTVSLNWSTATETNNKGFEVERSEINSGSGWTDIGFVNGAGNSNVTNNYSFDDKNIALNTIYAYRLKQVDIDGKFTYSPEVAIRVKDLQKSQLLMSVYPNPLASNSTIQYNIPETGMVSLAIYNTAGQKLITLVNANQPAGSYFSPINQSILNLKPGVYVCELTTDAGTVSSKFVKK